MVEHEILKRVANALNLPESLVPSVTAQNHNAVELAPGSSLCFTGEFVDQSGRPLERKQVEQFAKDAGFRVVPRVTKSKCDALVAVDTNASSGKTKLARKYGKPIYSATEFLNLLSQSA